MKLISNWSTAFLSVGTKKAAGGKKKERELMKRRGRPFHHHTRPPFSGRDFPRESAHSNEKKNKKKRETQLGTLRIVAACVVCRVVVSPLTSFQPHRSRFIHSPSLLCFRNKLDSWMRERLRKDTDTQKPVALFGARVPCDGIKERLITAKNRNCEETPTRTAPVSIVFWFFCRVGGD